MASYLDRSQMSTCKCDPSIAERNPMCPVHGRTADYHQQADRCRCGKRLPLELWKRSYVSGVPFCSDECAGQHVKDTAR